MRPLLCHCTENLGKSTAEVGSERYLRASKRKRFAAAAYELRLSKTPLQGEPDDMTSSLFNLACAEAYGRGQEPCWDLFTVDEPRERPQEHSKLECNPFTWRGSRISGMAISSRSIAPPAIMWRCSRRSFYCGSGSLPEPRCSTSRSASGAANVERADEPSCRSSGAPERVSCPLAPANARD